MRNSSSSPRAKSCTLFRSICTFASSSRTRASYASSKQSLHAIFVFLAFKEVPKILKNSFQFKLLGSLGNHKNHFSKVLQVNSFSGLSEASLNTIYQRAWAFNGNCGLGSSGLFLIRVVRHRDGIRSIMHLNHQ